MVSFLNWFQEILIPAIFLIKYWLKKISKEFKFQNQLETRLNYKEISIWKSMKKFGEEIERKESKIILQFYIFL